MQLALPQTFRFSWKITTTCLLLASVMLVASRWQWTRYLEKKELIATYEADSEREAIAFPASPPEDSYQSLLNRRVSVSGTFDYNHQMIVTNRKHASGPGHWLMTPLKLPNQEKYIIVSRGFIPFADDKPEEWRKYSFASEREFDAVLKESKTGSVLGPSNSLARKDNAFQIKWFYPDIEAMAKQLPYPVIANVYLQRLGSPPEGEFPARAILVEVPPSTHFGYTIEWIVLAAVTCLIGFLLQAFWVHRKKHSEIRGQPG